MTGAAGGVTFPSREISSGVGDVPILARRRGRVGLTQEGTRLVGRRGRDLQGDVADPRGSLRPASRCFSCRKSRVSESLIRNPPSPRNSAEGSTTGGSPIGGSSSSAGGRSSFSSGPKSRVNAPRSSSGRGSGPAGASPSSGTLVSVGRDRRLRSPMDGEDPSAPAERTRSKARSTSSFPGPAASRAGEEDSGAAGSSGRDGAGKGIRFPTGGGEAGSLAGGIPHRGAEVEETVPARRRRGGSAVLEDDDAVPAFPALDARTPSLDPGLVEAEPRVACLALDDHPEPPEDGVARRRASFRTIGNFPAGLKRGIRGGSRRAGAPRGRTARSRSRTARTAGRRP